MSRQRMATGHGYHSWTLLKEVPRGHFGSGERDEVAFLFVLKAEAMVVVVVLVGCWWLGLGVVEDDIS